MRKHIPPTQWINLGELARRGDQYDGVIDRVGDREVQNRYAKPGEPKVQVKPVIEFTDEMKLVLTITMLRQLMEKFGDESDRWIGRRLSVRRVRLSEAGTGREVWRRQLILGECEELATEPEWVSEIVASDLSDPIGDRDADSEQVVRFSRRRG